MPVQRRRGKHRALLLDGCNNSGVKTISDSPGKDTALLLRFIIFLDNLKYELTEPVQLVSICRICKQSLTRLRCWPRSWKRYSNHLILFKVSRHLVLLWHIPALTVLRLGLF